MLRTYQQLDKLKPEILSNYEQYSKYSLQTGNYTFDDCLSVDIAVYQSYRVPTREENGKWTKYIECDPTFYGLWLKVKLKMYVHLIKAPIRKEPPRLHITPNLLEYGSLFKYIFKRLWHGIV